MVEKITTGDLIEYVYTGNNSLRAILKTKVDNMSKQKYDDYTYTESGGYYEYIYFLNELNVAYYQALTQKYDVTPDVAATLIIPHTNQIAVPDMIKNDKDITQYCTDVHKSLSTVNSIQVYLSKLEELRRDLMLCDSWLEKQEIFMNLEWDKYE